MSAEELANSDLSSKNLPRVDAPEHRSLLPGMDRKGIKADKHPVWYPPAGDASTEAVHPLHVLNSFTEKLERFVPAAEASQEADQSNAEAPSKRRRVYWYTCGPTVYDVSHMGHARAYLTFDILRRVFEDYFGYEIVYQINITDIDDKIIKRARINKLIANYREANPSWEQVTKDAATATEFTLKVLQDRDAKLKEPLPENTPSRVRNERAEKIEELKLKFSQHDETRKKIEEALPKKVVNDLITAAANFMGDWLDAERGGSVTDNAIFDAHAKKYEKMYFEDMEALNIKEPDVVTRVSEVVPEVVSFVQKIIDNGFAYVAESSVFFDTQAYIKAGHDYPKLKPVADNLRNTCTTTEDEMAEGEGTLSMGNAGEKKSANDFALWKFSKPGEPAWDSPWGKGRPGWHIECSVMASGVLGKNMDVHAGGCDLKFPHHDNELAQSEAYWGHDQWVNFFLHCGHLHIKGLKMSKSLKNFITIRQALDPEGELKITSREMRILFLMNEWHKSMNFSDQSVGAAREYERTLRAFFGSVDIVLRSDWLKNSQTYSELDKTLLEALKKSQQEVHNALCNNIDTVTAMSSIMNIVSAGNKYLLACQEAGSGQAPSATILRKVAGYITKMFRTFGVINSGDTIGFEASGSADGAGGNDDRLKVAMDALIALRDDVRTKTREKQLAVAVMPMCDKVRDDILPVAGLRLEDNPKTGETSWKKDDPSVMMRERQERIEAEAAAKVKKLANQITTLQKQTDKWDKYSAPPNTFFSADPEESKKYSQYDNDGVPTHLADGTALDEKQMKNLKKNLDKYASGHQECLKKGDVAYWTAEKAKLAQMQAELAEIGGGNSNNNDNTGGAAASSS